MFQQCPNNIKFKIAEYLNYYELMNLLRTSRKMWSLSQNEDFWRYLLKIKFPDYVDGKDVQSTYRTLTVKQVVAELIPQFEFENHSYETYDNILYLKLRLVEEETLNLFYNLTKLDQGMVHADSTVYSYNVIYQNHQLIILNSDSDYIKVIDTEHGVILRTMFHTIFNKSKKIAHINLSDVSHLLLSPQCLIQVDAIIYMDAEINLFFELNSGYIVITDKIETDEVLLSLTYEIQYLECISMLIIRAEQWFKLLSVICSQPTSQFCLNLNTTSDTRDHIQGFELLDGLKVKTSEKEIDAFKSLHHKSFFNNGDLLSYIIQEIEKGA